MLEKTVTYSSENFIHYINENDIIQVVLIREFEEMNINIQDQKTIFKQIEFAFNKINSSLEITHAILLIFVPFGVINRSMDIDPFL